eukprot:145590-Amphidinium_carterae.1
MSKLLGERGEDLVIRLLAWLRLAVHAEFVSTWNPGWWFEAVVRCSRPNSEISLARLLCVLGNRDVLGVLTCAILSALMGLHGQSNGRGELNHIRWHWFLMEWLSNLIVSAT